MLSNPPSLEELHESRLNGLRRLSQVVKEGHRGLGGFTQLLERPEGNPLRGWRVPRDHDAEPSEIRGLVDCSVAVYQLDIEAAGYRLDDLRLPDTGRSDKEKGPAGLDRVFY
jgi:hypothetical protein